jgi:hypothetical protein
LAKPNLTTPLLDLVRFKLISSGLPHFFGQKPSHTLPTSETELFSELVSSYLKTTGMARNLIFKKIRIFSSKAFIKDPLVSSKLEAHRGELGYSEKNCENCVIVNICFNTG